MKHLIFLMVMIVAGCANTAGSSARSMGDIGISNKPPMNVAQCIAAALLEKRDNSMAQRGTVDIIDLLDGAGEARIEWFDDIMTGRHVWHYYVVDKAENETRLRGFRHHSGPKVDVSLCL